MDKETTTFGLSSKNLVHLLKIAEGSEQAQEKQDPQHTKTELLHDYLAQTIAVYGSAGQELSDRQSQLRNTMDILSGEPIGKLLQDPGTGIDLIRMVKDYSSRLSKRVTSKAEHQVANTIYYAAIAHALVFHKRRITRYTHETLGKSFSKLGREQWIPLQIGDLFARAAEVCHQKEKK